MKNRAIATSTLWQVASQLTMAALSIVTVKFVAIGLTKELAGNYNTAYGFLQIFGILADFGLYAVAVREVSRAQNKEHVLGAIFVLRCIILAISLSAALIIAWITPHWRGTPLPLGISIAALVPAFTLLAGIIRSAFQVEYKMHFVFIAEVLQRVITVTLTGVFIWMGVRGSSDVRVYLSFLLIGAAGSFALFAISVYYGGKLIPLRPRWDKPLLKSILVQAAPYGLAFLCTALYRQTDVTLIAQLRPDYERQNAYYGFVQRMMDMAYLLPTFLLNSTLPVLAARSDAGEDTRDFLGKIFMAILLLSSTSLLFAALWPTPLVQLLTTEQYLATATTAGSDTALQILSVSMFMNGIVLFCFYSLLTKHAWKPLVWTLAGAAVLSFVSNFALIPSLGFVGAAYTSVLVHCLLALFLLPQALRVLPIALRFADIARWVTYSVVLGAMLLVVRPWLHGSLSTVFWGLGIALILGVLVEILGIRRRLSS